MTMNNLREDHRKIPPYVKAAFVLALFFLAFIAGRVLLAQPAAAETVAPSQEAVPMLISADSVPTLPRDIADKPYKDAVYNLIKGKIVTGDVDGLFHPDKPLTRAEVCAMIVRTINPSMLYGTPTQEVQLQHKFTDLAGASWAEPYIAYAAAHGIVNGYGDGTFKPSNEVSAAELFAMVLRASGADIKPVTGADWQIPYVEGAVKFALLDGEINLSELAPAEQTKAYGAFAAKYKKAPKWAAAYCIYNQKDRIAQFEKTKMQKPDSAGGQPEVLGLSFATDNFDANMTKFGDLKFASDVVAYEYGGKTDYKKDMTIPATSGLQKTTIYKYKNAETPALYRLNSAGEIELIILPIDAGFTGRAYGVINGIGMGLNADGRAVKTVNSLVAGRAVSWICDENISDIPAAADLFKGDIYEMSLINGEVQSVFSVTGKFKGNRFVEINPAHVWTDVESAEALLVKIGGKYIDIKKNAVCYRLASSGNAYELASVDDIIAGTSLVRIFDISDDENGAADLVVIK